MLFRNLLIGVAIFGLGWGASFGAGVAYGRRAAPATAQAATAPGGQGAQSGQAGAAAQAGQGNPAAQAGAGRAVAGTVERVDGRTITLAGPNNQSFRVTLSDQTSILKTVAGTPADLAPGVRLTVQAQGQPAADGTITAATITILPEGAPGAGAGADRGQGGQRPPQRPAG